MCFDFEDNNGNEIKVCWFSWFSCGHTNTSSGTHICKSTSASGPYIQTRFLTSSIFVAQIGETPNIPEANDFSSHGEQKLRLVGPFLPGLTLFHGSAFFWPRHWSRGTSGYFLSHGLSVYCMHNKHKWNATMSVRFSPALVHGNKIRHFIHSFIKLSFFVWVYAKNMKLPNDVLLDLCYLLLLCCLLLDLLDL